MIFRSQLLTVATSGFLAVALLAGCATQAPPPDEAPQEEQIEIDVSNSPAGGSFSASLDFGQADPSVLEIYVNYPQLGQHVQVMVSTEEAETKQVYSLTLSEADLDGSGDYRNGPSVTDTVSLEPGSYSVEILVDGVSYFGPVSHEVAGEPEPEPEPVQAAPAPSGPRACTQAELEIVSGSIIWGYIAAVGTMVGEEGHYADFVNRMNGNLGATNSSKVKTVLRDAIAWADGGLVQDGRYFAYQSKAEEILNTGEC